MAKDKPPEPPEPPESLGDVLFSLLDRGTRAAEAVTEKIDELTGERRVRTTRPAPASSAKVSVTMPPGVTLELDPVRLTVTPQDREAARAAAEAFDQLAGALRELWP